MEYFSIVKIGSRFFKYLYSRSRYSEFCILLRVRLIWRIGERIFVIFYSFFRKNRKIFHSINFSSRKYSVYTYYKYYLRVNIYKILIDIKFIFVVIFLWIDQKLFTRLRYRHVPSSFRNGFWLKVLEPIKSNWYNAVVSTRRAINYITNVYKCFRIRIIKLKL